MKLIIKRQDQNWIYFLLIYVVFSGFLISELGLPSSITYITDAIMLIFVLKYHRNIVGGVKNSSSHIVIIILITMLVIIVFGALINFTAMSPLRFLWGFRNMGRTYIFMFCCISMLNLKDVKWFLSFFNKLLIVNVFLCSWQFWVQGLWCDTVGGIFGTDYGCLAYLHLHLAFVVIYNLSQFINKEIKISKLIFYVSICFYLATITELKIFFVEFILFLIFIILLAKPSLKTFSVIVIAVIGFSIGMNFFSLILPDAAGELTVEGIIENLTRESGYTGSGDLSRFTAVPIINEMFFSGDKLLEWFGFGLGNCDTSSFDLLNTPFYIKYEFLNYRWFTTAMMYLETGISGLILFYTFLVVCIVIGIENRKKIKDKTTLFTGIIFTFVVIILSIYNSSFRTEAGYLTAFGLSIIFVVIKNEKGAIDEYK